MERWLDVGPLLEAARADLKVGELLAGESFSLFEAMSALEAGNPKMDAAASTSVHRPTLEALLADPNVAPWDLPIPTFLAVLDQLLAMEASWHCGGSAMQTVYACFYMLKLDGAQQQQYDSPSGRALYTYCRTLQHDCALVRDLVMSGAVCEEEDISVFTAGIPFEPPADGAASVLAALDAAIVAATDANSSGSGGGGAVALNGCSSQPSTSSTSSSSPSAAAPESTLGEAVALRLRLRRAVHLGLKQATSRNSKEVSGAGPYFEEVRALIPRIRETSSFLTPTPTSTSATSSSTASTSSSSTSTFTPPPVAAATSSSLATATSSSALGTRNDGSSSGGGGGGGGRDSSTVSSSPSAAATPPTPPPLPPGFQVDVNRHLLGPAPPRQVKLMSFSETLSYMDRMAEHMLLAVAVSEHVHDYRSLQLFLWRFARMRPGAVARSVLHSLIMADRWQAQVPASSGAASGQDQHHQPHDTDEAVPHQNGLAELQPSPPSQQQQQEQQGTGRGSGGGGRKGGKARKGGSSSGGSKAQQQQQQQKQEQQQTTTTTPAWVPTNEMLAAACRVPYKAGLPEEAEMFFEQAVIATSNVFQAVLMNRCRSRRRLRRCLDDWYNMYHHGLNADVVPAFREHLRASGWRWRPLDGMPAEDEQGPLGTWVEVQTSLTMLHHLLMGFELELYEPLEYDMIYWYCDFLCTNSTTAYAAILQRCPPAQPPKLPPAPTQQHHQSLGGGRGLGRGLGRARGLGGRAGGGGGGGTDSAAAAAAEAAMARFEREQMQLRYELLEVEVMQQLCQGMLRLMVGLRLAGSMPEHHSPPPFNSSEQRFDQRFAAFMTLPKPLPLTHADYVASTDPGDRDAAFLMGLASASFKEARLRCSALAGLAASPDVAASGWVRGLERVAATNAVVAGVLRAKMMADNNNNSNNSSGGGGGGKVNWECDWSLHPFFPAIVLPKPSPAPTAATAATSIPAITATAATASSVPSPAATAPAPAEVTAAAAGPVSS